LDRNFHGSTSSDKQHALAVSLPTVNAEQYQQLLTFLNKQQEER